MGRDVSAACEMCGQAFVHRGDARYCPDCRPLARRARRTKYPLTETVKQVLYDEYNSNVRGRAAAIGRKLGWPKWAVTKAARKLGLARPWPPGRRTWTAAEDAELNRWAGLRSPEWIARRLDRSAASVTNRLKRLRISRKHRVGYTARDLGEFMGVHGKTVSRWVEQGYLRAERRGTQRANDPYVVHTAAIRQFLRDHRDEYRLSTVDQDWFLQIVFDVSDDEAEHEEGAVYLPTPQQIEQQVAVFRRRRQPAAAQQVS